MPVAVRTRRVRTYLCVSLCAALKFLESSALNSSNVEKAFMDLIEEIYNRVHAGEFSDRLE